MTQGSTSRLALIAVTAFTFIWFPIIGNTQDGVLSAQVFAERAAASNTFEIEAARVALEKAKDEEARTFAKDMISDHEKAGLALAMAAKEENIQFDEVLDEQHRKQLDALKAAPDKDFDQAYLSTQVLAHEEVVKLFNEYAQSSNAGALKAFAEKSLGTLRAHNVRIHGLTKK